MRQILQQHGLTVKYINRPEAGRHHSAFLVTVGDLSVEAESKDPASMQEGLPSAVLPIRKILRRDALQADFEQPTSSSLLTASIRLGLSMMVVFSVVWRQRPCCYSGSAATSGTGEPVLEDLARPHPAPIIIGFSFASSPPTQPSGQRRIPTQQAATHSGSKTKP